MSQKQHKQLGGRCDTEIGKERGRKNREERRGEGKEERRAQHNTGNR